MEVLYPRCCGLDVHKSSIAACALLREQGRIRTERRRFTKMTQDLESLAAWLQQLQVTHVAIESTGVYWKPIWNVLEGHFSMVLANAQHVRTCMDERPMRRTVSGLRSCCSMGFYEAATFRRRSFETCEI